MSETREQVLLAARPVGLPKESDFELRREPIPEPGEGEVLVRVAYLSLDPAMRGWMSDRKSYIEPVGLGEVMRGFAVGRVVRSKAQGLAAGDAVAGMLGWQTHALAPARALQKIPPGIELPVALGPLGATGLTAYFGLLDVGRPRPGETVLVSAAAGATGSVVGQIARIEGCRAVGIAGSEEKCRWLTDELGFEAAVCYRTTQDLRGDLRRACPEGVDVFFDNVGGEILDTALTLINRKARVVICGAISQYNATEPVPGPSNYLNLLVQRARMEGFLIFDYQDRFPEAQAALGRWIAEGKIRHRQHIVEGLKNAPGALLRLFDGSHQGKLLVKVDADA